jgi:hypothetical protein
VFHVRLRVVIRRQGEALRLVVVQRVSGNDVHSAKYSFYVQAIHSVQSLLTGGIIASECPGYVDINTSIQ